MSMMGISLLGQCSYPYDKQQTLGELNPTDRKRKNSASDIIKQNPARSWNTSGSCNLKGALSRFASKHERLTGWVFRMGEKGHHE